MTIEAQDDVVALQRIGRIVSLVLQQMLDAAEPGMTTCDLDLLGERLLAEHGARSAPRMTCNFPGSTCISISEEAAHGIPGDRVIRSGDVLNVDVLAELGGYFADTGGTTVAPPSSARQRPMDSRSLETSEATVLAVHCMRSRSISLASSTLRTNASCRKEWSSPLNHSCRPRAAWPLKLQTAGRSHAQAETCLRNTNTR